MPPGIDPSYTEPCALIAVSGPVQPASGPWQVAHDWLAFSERFSSKKMALPSSSCGVSAGAVGDNRHGGAQDHQPAEDEQRPENCRFALH